jgi:hypothetical protein
MSVYTARILHGGSRLNKSNIADEITLLAAELTGTDSDSERVEIAARIVDFDGQQDSVDLSEPDTVGSELFARIGAGGRTSRRGNCAPDGL